MKRVKNLTENKDLIITFKKSKLRGYLGKSFFKKKDFFFLKFRQPKYKHLFGFFSKTFFYKNVFHCFFFFEKSFFLKKVYSNNNHIKTILMFNIFIFLLKYVNQQHLHKDLKKQHFY